MDTERYLERIGYGGPVKQDFETLRALAIAHQETVPFENLDIHFGVPIELDTDALYRKIVERERGGYCYELNSTFGWLLSELGFEVELFAARVFRESSPGLPFDHLTLGVTVGGVRYLTDVGFGDGFYEPMELRAGAAATRFDRDYRIDRRGPSFVLEVLRSGELDKGLELQPIPRSLEQFARMNQYHSSDPRSWWVRELVITRATPRGRVSLVGRRWTERTDGDVTREELSDRQRIERLREIFGIEVPYMPRVKATRLTSRARRQAQIAVHRAGKLLSLASDRLRKR